MDRLPQRDAMINREAAVNASYADALAASRYGAPASNTALTAGVDSLLLQQQHELRRQELIAAARGGLADVPHRLSPASNANFSMAPTASLSQEAALLARQEEELLRLRDARSRIMKAELEAQAARDRAAAAQHLQNQDRARQAQILAQADLFRGNSMEQLLALREQQQAEARRYQREIDELEQARAFLCRHQANQNSAAPADVARFLDTVASRRPSLDELAMRQQQEIDQLRQRRAATQQNNHPSSGYGNNNRLLGDAMAARERNEMRRLLEEREEALKQQEAIKQQQHSLALGANDHAVLAAALKQQEALKQQQQQQTTISGQQGLPLSSVGGREVNDQAAITSVEREHLMRLLQLHQLSDDDIIRRATEMKSSHGTAHQETAEGNRNAITMEQKLLEAQLLRLNQNFQGAEGSRTNQDHRPGSGNFDQANADIMAEAARRMTAARSEEKQAASLLNNPNLGGQMAEAARRMTAARSEETGAASLLSNPSLGGQMAEAARMMTAARSEENGAASLLSNPNLGSQMAEAARRMTAARSEEKQEAPLLNKPNLGGLNSSNSHSSRALISSSYGSSPEHVGTSQVSRINNTDNQPQQQQQPQFIDNFNRSMDTDINPAAFTQAAQSSMPGGNAGGQALPPFNGGTITLPMDSNNIISKFLSVVVTRVPEIAPAVADLLPNSADPARLKREFPNVVDATLAELRSVQERYAKAEDERGSDLRERATNCIAAIEPYKVDLSVSGGSGGAQPRLALRQVLPEPVVDPSTVRALVPNNLTRFDASTSAGDAAAAAMAAAANPSQTEQLESEGQAKNAMQQKILECHGQAGANDAKVKEQDEKPKGAAAENLPTKAASESNKKQPPSGEKARDSPVSSGSNGGAKKTMMKKKPLTEAKQKNATPKHVQKSITPKHADSAAKEVSLLSKKKSISTSKPNLPANSRAQKGPLKKVVRPAPGEGGKKPPKKSRPVKKRRIEGKSQPVIGAGRSALVRPPGRVGEKKSNGDAAARSVPGGKKAKSAAYPEIPAKSSAGGVANAAAKGPGLGARSAAENEEDNHRSAANVLLGLMGM